MDRLLENDLVVKIVSVLLAIALWFQVVVGQGASSRDVQRVIPGVAVSWRNLPPDLAVVSVDPKTVTVTVRGDSATIDALTPGSLSAILNLSGAQAGRQAFYVEVSVPRGVSLISPQPSNVTAVLESVIEREMPFALVTQGAPAAGFRAGQPTLTPSTAIVRGPGSLVDRVATVRVTVDLTGATAAVSAAAKPQAVDAEGAPVDGVEVLPASVRVDVPVNKSLPARSVNVNVKLAGQPASGYSAGTPTATPATVTVEGSEDALAKLNAIDTEPINISGAKANVSQQAGLVLPAGVVAADPATVRVTVPIVRSP